MANVENSQNRNQLEYRHAVYKIGLNVSISIEKCIEIKTFFLCGQLSVSGVEQKPQKFKNFHFFRLCGAQGEGGREKGNPPLPKWRDVNEHYTQIVINNTVLLLPETDIVFI